MNFYSNALKTSFFLTQVLCNFIQKLEDVVEAMAEVPSAVEQVCNYHYFWSSGGGADEYTVFVR